MTMKINALRLTASYQTLSSLLPEGETAIGATDQQWLIERTNGSITLQLFIDPDRNLWESVSRPIKLTDEFILGSDANTKDFMYMYPCVIDTPARAMLNENVLICNDGDVAYFQWEGLLESTVHAVEQQRAIALETTIEEFLCAMPDTLDIDDSDLIHLDCYIENSKAESQWMCVSNTTEEAWVRMPVKSRMVCADVKSDSFSVSLPLKPMIIIIETIAFVLKSMGDLAEHARLLIVSPANDNCVVFMLYLRKYAELNDPFLVIEFEL